MKAILCLLCSAAAFPAMLTQERWLPILPAPEAIAWQADRVEQQLVEHDEF